MKLIIQALLGLLLLVCCVESQYRRLVRTKSGPGLRRRVKKVKIFPTVEKQQQQESLKTLQTEAASERLLNPFSLFNLVRFPNTACTTDRGQSLSLSLFIAPDLTVFPPQVVRVSATPPRSAADEEGRLLGPVLEGLEPAAPSSVSVTQRLLRTGRSSPVPPPSPPCAA